MSEKNDVQASDCTHNCSTCTATCSSKEAPQKDSPHKLSNIKHVIGVVSGKGGVGKSIVTSMLSVILQRKGYKIGILDADITGPSIPKAFGAKGDIINSGEGLLPIRTKTGIEMISVNLLLEEETRPVVWRGPVIAGTVKQFWSDVIWDVDYLFVDMPPGTGDVPLTVFQSVPVDGIVIVTTPQELVSMIVKKAANMAKLMKIPVIGLVENMSYLKCPDCSKKIEIFGASKVDAVAAEFGYDVLAKIPLDSKLSALCDTGIIELMENDYLDEAAGLIERMFK